MAIPASLPGGGDHSDYSKRPMALDGVEVMKHLGYNQFRMVGHDRGGRVGRRMALDHPDKVTKLAVLDIVPAHYLYSHVTIEFVQAYFHWFNYLRAGAGSGKRTAQGHARPQTRRPTTDEVQNEYRAAQFRPRDAPCDVRGLPRLGFDRSENRCDADIKAGKKIQCPLHVLWAANGAMGKYTTC